MDHKSHQLVGPEITSYKTGNGRPPLIEPLPLDTSIPVIQEIVVATEAHRQAMAQTIAAQQPVPTNRPQVVVVGAGFGGLSVIRTLADADVDVLIVDRNNYHGFWPLLYQVATAGLEPESIAYPVRAIVRDFPHVQFRMIEVTGVDFERRLVNTTSEPIPYDYLVLAAGSANNYFGNQELAENTLGMKDIDDAERMRNHILNAFEQAVQERDPARRAALLTLAIIGGGPTGVELAGAFVELIRHVLKKDFPLLDIGETRVLLVEASQEILSTFPETLRMEALHRLQAMGVEVTLGARVARVEGDSITFQDGTSIPAGTVVWAAGVRAAQLADALGVDQARGARVKITPTLNLSRHPEVFVIGDMAYLEGFRGGTAFPMVAPVAVQMGQQAARNILAHHHRRPLRAFRYVDKGQLATIGRRAAVLDAFGFRLSGRVAWFGWLFVHIMQLVGFRNRLIVLTNWTVNYLTYDRGVRLITRIDC